MTYDHWKTTEPEPFEEDRPVDDDGPDCGEDEWPRECDCCGKLRKLTRTDYAGIETFACDECRGDK